MSSSVEGRPQVLPEPDGGGPVSYGWDGRPQESYAEFARLVIRSEYEGFTAGIQNLDAGSEDEILERLCTALEQELDPVGTVEEGKEEFYAERLLEGVGVKRRMRKEKGAIGASQELKKDGYALTYPQS